ncbi:MAG TPA: hypothetical protein VGB85_19130 [Nannocystis sp.]
MLTRSPRSAACLLLLSAATLACPSNESFESLGDTPATTTATTGGSDPATSSTGAPDTEPTSSSTGGTSTTDSSTTDTSTTDVDTTTDGTTGTTGEPSNLCPDHMATDACCCFETHMGFSVSNVCGTESLCALAQFECNQNDDTCTAVDEVVVDCVLEALRDGTMAGELKVDYNIDQGFGRRKIDLYLQGDGSAYVVDANEEDLSGVSRATGRHLLREPAYFEDCLMGDAQIKADCLENVLGGKATEVCTDEYQYDVN